MALGKAERKPLDPGLKGLRPPIEIQVDHFDDEPDENRFYVCCGEFRYWCGRRRDFMTTWWYTRSPKHRFIFVGVLFLLFIGALVGIIIAANSGGGGDEKATVPAPMAATSDLVILDDPANRESNILAKLERVSSTEDLTDEDTPQYAAFRWIIIHDPLQLQSSSIFLAQRYTIVVFFFALNGPDWKMEDPWVETDGFEKGRGVATPESECLWKGIECGSGNLIVHIYLNEMGLKGQLPSSEFTALPHLKKLDLRGNALRGMLPDELTELSHLDVLLLQGNAALTGSVPSELCGVVKWLTVDCETMECSCCANCNDDDVTIGINGPESGGDGAEGRVSQINELVQTFSPDVTTLGSPQNLALNWILYEDKRNLSINDLTLLQRYALGVIYYALGGPNWPIGSSWLTEESECKYPGISCNGLGVVTTIAMVENGLEGTLPPELGLLDDLEYIDLSDNKINGEIPPQLAELISLESLLLQNNNLEAIVPAQVCELREGELKELKTDCDGDDPKVLCGCCTNCDGIIMDEKGEEDRPMLDYFTLFGRRGERVAEILESVSEDIYTPDTTRAEAMEWILKEDPMSLEHDDDGLVQRWVMTLLYFQFGGSNWVYTDYLNGDSECEWDQVTCDDDGHVTAITLTNGGLMGVVPYELGVLDKLKVLDLRGNFIEGEVPEEFCEEEGASDYALESVIFDCLDPPLVDCECCDQCDFDESSGPTTSGNPKKIDYLAVFGRRGQRIAEALQTVSEEIYDLGSNRAAAAEWIIKEDAMDLEHSDPLLMQRFVLALLYFQLDGANWIYTDYLTGEDECQWDGITCNDNNEVTDIILTDAGLLGAVPFELGVLDSLKVLDLHGNRIEGEVPEEFCAEEEGSEYALETLIFDCMEPALVDCDCCTPCQDVHGVDNNEDESSSNSILESGTDVDYQSIAGRRGQRIADVLKAVSDRVYLAGSSASSATIWLVRDDPMGLEHDDEGLVQRWIMAVLYYQMDGANWEVKSFLSGDSECDWDGITCNDNGEVTSIVLTRLGLVGVIPPEIAGLGKLTALDLRDNRLEGNVPDELCKDKLEVLVLDCATVPLVECNCCTPCEAASP